MIKEIREVFDNLNDGTITLAEAEQEIIDLWDSSQPSNECMCCYMTTGEHSDNCPQRLVV